MALTFNITLQLETVKAMRASTDFEDLLHDLELLTGTTSRVVRDVVRAVITGAEIFPFETRGKNPVLWGLDSFSGSCSIKKDPIAPIVVTVRDLMMKKETFSVVPKATSVNELLSMWRTRTGMSDSTELELWEDYNGEDLELSDGAWGNNLEDYKVNQDSILIVKPVLAHDIEITFRDAMNTASVVKMKDDRKVADLGSIYKSTSGRDYTNLKLTYNGVTVGPGINGKKSLKQIGLKDGSVIDVAPKPRHEGWNFESSYAGSESRHSSVSKLERDVFSGANDSGWCMN